jgi:hypothetical protein
VQRPGSEDPTWKTFLPFWAPVLGDRNPSADFLTNIRNKKKESKIFPIIFNLELVIVYCIILIYYRRNFFYSFCDSRFQESYSEGIRTWDLWVSVLIESNRRAMAGGTPAFLGQLIASLLVAQWSERWCTNLVAHGLIPGMSCSESAITRGKTQMMLLPPTSFS